jgi:hypothetical protein
MWRHLASFGCRAAIPSLSERSRRSNGDGGTQLGERSYRFIARFTRRVVADAAQKGISTFHR